MPAIVTFSFADNFLDRLTEHIHREYVLPGKDLRRLAVVFGGHRPTLFLKRALAKRLKACFYPPRFFTIDEWMAHMSPQQRRLPDLDHCFVIYELVHRHAPHILQGKEDFVHFLPWAREILNFIEQLDLEDTPKDALHALKEHAVLGFDVPESINQLLESLMELREHYHRYFQEHEVTSRGHQYLLASRAAATFPADDFDQILFCNFFYLHRTEMTVIKNLYERGKASLIIQGDQRRWPALRRIAEKFGQPIVEGREVAPTNFHMKVYGVFDMHAQAALVAQILQSVKDQEHTVVVLPNPDFILPLLSAIGPVVGDFNISLGYPLKRSSLYALLEAVVSAQKSMKGDLYYSRDYLRLLRHPLVQGLQIGLEPGVLGVLIHHLEEILTGSLQSPISGQLFLSQQDILGDELLFSQTSAALKAMDLVIGPPRLRKAMEQLHQQFFAGWNQLSTFTGLAQVMDGFCALVSLQSGVSVYPFNERVSVRLMQIAAEWSGAKFGGAPFDRLDLLRIMQERLGREMIAFSGSPLKGLQVLGLLETRSLSFDTVIVVDANEKVLPNLNIYEPLIPREVMIKMNLDRLELEEEIQRYQFMRLIASAKNVHLIYQDRPDKERSRFIEELIWQQEQKAGKLDVVPIARPAFRVALNESRCSVPKTADIMQFLKAFTFSATSINTYQRNPYEFYLNYVLGLREKEDLLDEPEGRHIGTFVHGLLEDAFAPWVGKKPVIGADFRRNFNRLFEARFHRQFGRGLKSDAFLMKVVLENRLGRFLDAEAIRLEEEVREILFIERRFEDVIPLSCGPVRFSYRVDRVDRLQDGTVMVLDYKTGGGAPSEPSFQMPLYLYYLHKQYPQDRINAAQYQLKTLSIDKYITAKNVLPRAQMIEGFIKQLDEVVGEIFNPEIPFAQAHLDIE